MKTRASLRESTSGSPSNETFLALIEDAFRRLLEEPEARDHVTGFASGDVAFVATRGRPGGQAQDRERQMP